MKRIKWCLALIIILTLAIAGCDTQEETPTAEELVPIRIAYPSAGTLISGQIGLILQRSDLLEKNGLEAEIFPMSTGREMKSALVAGQVDVILTSESNFIVLLGTGFPCYGIASLGSDGRMGLVVQADSGIQSIGELKGKKIGTIFGTSVHKPAIEWARQGGLTPGEDVEIVSMGGGGPLRAAFASQDLDAIIDWDPHLTDGVRSGKYTKLAETDLDLIVVMSADYADSNPEWVHHFSQALKDASFYLSQNKEEVNGWYSEVAALDAELIDEVSRYNQNYLAEKPEDIDISISEQFAAKLAEIADFLYEEELIETNPSVADHIR